MKHESGQGMVEYALILVLVGVTLLVIFSIIGPSIGNVMQKITADIDKREEAIAEVTATPVPIPTATPETVIVAQPKSTGQIHPLVLTLVIMVICLAAGYLWGSRKEENSFFGRDERGSSTVEVAVCIALIIVVLLCIYGLLADTINPMLADIANPANLPKALAITAHPVIAGLVCLFIGFGLGWLAREKFKGTPTGG